MDTKQKKHTKTPKEKPEQKPKPTQKPEQKPKPTQKQKPEQKPKHTKHRIIKAPTEPTDKPKLVDSIVVFI